MIVQSAGLVADADFLHALDMITSDHSLSIHRVLKAPLAHVWRCWSEPELFCQWFCPRPWRVSEARLDLRAGGEFFARMQGPEGEVQEMAGVFLVVEPGAHILFTDAFVPGWMPSQKAFMVGEIRMRALGADQTDYTGLAHHWNAVDFEAHQKMGFDEGWSVATKQLEDLAASLKP